MIEITIIFLQVHLHIKGYEMKDTLQLTQFFTKDEIQLSEWWKCTQWQKLGPKEKFESKEVVA